MQRSPATDVLKKISLQRENPLYANLLRCAAASQPGLPGGKTWLGLSAFIRRISVISGKFS